VKVRMADPENRQIFRLFWPVFIELGLSTLIGVVSAIMVSGVGDFAVSGVTLVDTINQTIMAVFTALAAGATVVIAQKIGAKATRDAGEFAMQAILICVLSAGVLGLAVVFGGKYVLASLYKGAEANVLEAAGIYFLFSGISYPFIGLGTACIGVMRAAGNNRSPMLASALANIINITVAYILIWLGMGVYGAAIAVLCARAVSGVFALIMLQKGNFLGFILPKKWLRLSLDILKPILRIGVPSGVDSMIFNGARVVLAVFLSQMGTAALHANAIANSLNGFILLPGNAIATVAVTLVGQSYGAKLYKKVKGYMKTLSVYCSAANFVMFIILFIFSDRLIGLYGPSEETAMIAQRLLIALGVFASLVWCFAFCLPQTLRACGDAKATMFISVLSLIALRVPGAWLFGIHLGWGIYGVWAGMFLDWCGRGVGFFIRSLRFKFPQ